MEQLVRLLHRAALCALVLVLFLSAIATVTAAPSPAASTYTLTGYADQPGGISAPPVPAGVTVNLVSAATGTTYKAVTAAGGVFTFTSASTSSGLGPGYWKLVVPTETNVSVGKCTKCAVLPQDQNPAYDYFTSADLTNKEFATTISNVLVVPYNATQNGTVHQGGLPVAGASVDLLDANYNGLVLSNTTTNASGEFTLKVPWGHWLLQSVHVSGKNTYTNTSALTIATPTPALVNPVLYAFSISGWINSTLGRIAASGNVTLFDPTNDFIYSTATPAGGYYSLATYPAGFSHGAQKFDVLLAANGYETTWYHLLVNHPGAIQRNVVTGNISTGSMGIYTTTLNFSAIDTATGKGSLTVTTFANLGNDSVVPALPNASVGQLWAQLGLDYNHGLSFPAADAAAVQAYVNARGPTFLPTQAATTLNATPFVPFTTPQTLSNFTSGCAVSCNQTSSANLTYKWSETYALNGTLAKNSSTYTLGFTFQHPASSSLVYNYSIVLPAGYVLSADTTAPVHTTLTPTGPSGTWGQFTLSSTSATTPSASAKFVLVKAATVTPVVNVTSTNFTFSSANVLNDSEGNYTVVLGLNEPASFSAANSKYGSSTNGSMFSWNFGDGSPVVSTANASGSYNHTYAIATPTTTFPLNTSAYQGTLTITTSGGQTNSTHFYVWVLKSTPTAVISSNATTAEQMLAGGTKPYLQINWSTTLSFTANNSTRPTGNPLSIASFSLVATKAVHKSANFTVSSGGNVSANWSVDFSPPKTIGTGKYITGDLDVGGTLVPLTAGEFGWEYNLTLTVWSSTGTSSMVTLPILVVDTQAPTSAFAVLNGAGKAISGNAITEGAGGTAKVELNAATTVDPNNGTIDKYSWNVTNGNNSSLAFPVDTVLSVKPYPVFMLMPETNPYTINLTVTDGNGNTANHTFSLTVSPNASTRPVMFAATLTGPTSLTEGKSSTYWVNVSNQGGAKSIADSVVVVWWVKSASGTGSDRYITSPTSFYNYSGGSVVASPWAKTVDLAKNHTVRAVMTWTPSFTGNYVLYANATATNEFMPDYHGSSSVAALSVTIHPNPTTELLEYGAIAAVVVVAIVLLVWWTRRPARKAGSGGKSTGRGGLERGSKKPDTDTKDDDA
ncbi:MAG: hypothetical protein WAK40_08090 [Thermoplasmata archaeon]